MKIYYDKKYLRRNALICILCGLFCAAGGGACASYLREIWQLMVAGMIFLIAATFLLCATLVFIRSNRPYALEFGDNGVTPYKGVTIPYEQIEAIRVYAQITRAAAKPYSPSPELFAALPPLPHLTGAVHIVTRKRVYAFIQTADAMESYAMLSGKLNNVYAILMNSGINTDYLFDRYGEDTADTLSENQIKE